MWSLEAPEGWPTPALEKRTAHSTHLCQGMGRGMSLGAVPSPSEVGHCVPNVAHGERRQGAQVPKMVQRPRSPWRPTSTYRPRGKK